MKNEVFNKLAKQETDRMLDVMCSKSSDYAKNDDKLFNFKQAGQIDNIPPIEALRGMWLKHRASIQQGLNELLEGGRPRSREWWVEKLTDDRNYNLLLFAQLEEEYFLRDGTSPGYENNTPNFGNLGHPGYLCICAGGISVPPGSYNVAMCGKCGGLKPIEDNEPEEFEEFLIRKSCSGRKEWFVDSKNPRYEALRFLYKDLKIYKYLSVNKYGECHYKTKDEARETIRAYKNKVVYGVDQLKNTGWFAHRTVDRHATYLYPDLIWHDAATPGFPIPLNSAYHPTKEIAEAYLKAYKEKNNGHN